MKEFPKLTVKVLEPGELLRLSGGIPNKNALYKRQTRRALLVRKAGGPPVSIDDFRA